jgi:hypothetical protein
MEYKKSKDGNHFYRIGDNILHVFHAKSDSTIIQERESLTMTTEIKKDDCCINTISEINDDKVDCSKEEFETELKEAIFILGIYDFCKLIKN